MGAWDDYIKPGLETVGGVGEIASLPGHSMIPYAGAAAGLLGAGMHTYQAINSEGTERWDHIGEAVTNGIGAIPLIGAGMGATELLWNGTMAAAYGSHGAHEQGLNIGQLVGEDLRYLTGNQPYQQPGYVAPDDTPAVQPVDPGTCVDPSAPGGSCAPVRVGTTTVEHPMPLEAPAME
ncbi:MAG: hypothetical protein H6708_25935 [Kofleriaceae bacterium]|nr:hypothetical protein [Myxococcales bacterium]MCB9563850.1 hypothetical protein [Kofleriaceae bacterium]